MRADSGAHRIFPRLDADIPRYRGIYKKRMSCDNPIGLFDSGVGGLSVLTECVRLMPNERYIYLADRAHMPYGGLSADDIKSAALGCAARLVAMNCKAIAVACNTATETAIADIRRSYPGFTVVGLEPAVKPCGAELCGGYAVALVTPATARAPGFKRLMEEYGDRITVAPQPELAAMIERGLGDIGALAPYVESMLDPYRDAEAVILGCSHYSCIANAVKRFYGGNIKIYDGADGAAARLSYCLALAGLLAPQCETGSMRFLSTARA